MKKTALQIKIMAVNLIREYAKEMIAYELEHFNQFIGVDIFKVDGSIKAKYDHEKKFVRKQLPDGTFLDVHYWFKKGYSSLNMTVKLCINGGSHDDKTAFCHYEELNTTLYNLPLGDALKPADTDRSYLDERFDENTLKEQAAKVKAIAEQYRAELKKVAPEFRDELNLEYLR